MTTRHDPPPRATAAATISLPWPALATALTAFVALYVSARGLPLLFLFTLVILASYVTRLRLEGKTPLRWFVRLAFVALIVLVSSLTAVDSTGMYEQIGPARNRNLFGEVCAAEVVVQFWRRRNNGDDPAQSVLVVLLMSGMVFLTASNTYEEAWIRFLAPLFLLFVALTARHWRPRRASSSGGGSAPGPLALRGLALVVALGLGAAGYRSVQAYRGVLTDWGNRILAKDNWEIDGTGMSSQPTLGPLFDLRGSPARVLRIEGFAGDPHLRAMSFAVYSHGMWGPTIGERPFVAASPAQTHPPAADRITGTSDMRVTRLIDNTPLVFAPLSAVAFDREEARGVEWAPQEGGPIRVRAHAPYEYIVTLPPESKVETYQGLLAAPLKPTDRDRYLAVPHDTPEMRDVARLAHRITKGANSVPARIEAITSYLLTHHPYSLRYVPGGHGADPVADFLLSEPPKGAHCEFFASSATLLLRDVGVPARYVTGYYAHESGGKDITVVRQRDAHAWCEAWVNGIGWVVVEATPGSGRPDGSPEAVEPWRRSWEWLQDSAQALGMFVANLTPTQISAAMGALLVVGALVAFVLVLRRRRRRARSHAEAGWVYSQGDAALEEIAARFERVWSARRPETPFPPNRTYGDFLRLLPQEGSDDPDDMARAREIARLYDAARFGGQTDDEVLASLRALVTEMEETNPA